MFFSFPGSFGFLRREMPKLIDISSVHRFVCVASGLSSDIFVVLLYVFWRMF